MIIFKNNKPDLVLFDFEEYEKLLQKIDAMEDILIAKSIEERDKEDNGTRYSFDDAKLLSKKNHSFILMNSCKKQVESNTT